MSRPCLRPQWATATAVQSRLQTRAFGLPRELPVSESRGGSSPRALPLGRPIVLLFAPHSLFPLFPGRTQARCAINFQFPRGPASGLAAHTPGIDRALSRSVSGVSYTPLLAAVDPGWRPPHIGTCGNAHLKYKPAVVDVQPSVTSKTKPWSTARRSPSPSQAASTPAEARFPSTAYCTATRPSRLRRAFSAYRVRRGRARRSPCRTSRRCGATSARA